MSQKQHVCLLAATIHVTDVTALKIHVNTHFFLVLYQHTIM